MQLAPLHIISLTFVECQLTAHACPTYMWMYISESLERCSWQTKYLQAVYESPFHCEGNERY